MKRFIAIILSIVVLSFAIVSLYSCNPKPAETEQNSEIIEMPTETEGAESEVLETESEEETEGTEVITDNIPVDVSDEVTETELVDE